MHQSVLDFGRANLTAADVAGREVMEVGSYDVNGSLRPHVMTLSPERYIGVDLEAGPGVDLVYDFCGALPSAKRYGLLICTEMLEHAEDWRKAIRNMKHILKPGGVILLTTRSVGFAKHYEHPGDFWRFSLENMRDIFSDFDILCLQSDPGGAGGGPGVFLKASKPLHEGKLLGPALENIEVYSMEKEAA